MKGSIAQIVALTVHGNLILQNGLASGSDEFQRQNSTFRFCEFVNFIDGPAENLPHTEALYAADPQHWFERLKGEGVRGFRISYAPSVEPNVPDRRLAGFVGGGGKWAIETRKLSSWDFWIPRWQIGKRDRKDNRIWRVSYLRVPGRMTLPKEDPDDLEQLKLELKQCLQQIAQFSRSQTLEGFAEAFESGVARLESPDPLADAYHTDIVPPGFLSLAANQLLSSAQAAWVFGGMGSWNDLGFEGETQARYDHLSEELYRLLNGAIAAAANSSTP